MTTFTAAMAAAVIAAAVMAFWFAIYRTLPTYPPTIGMPLALAGALFLSGLALLHRLHAASWSGLARCGFVISTLGLGLWTIGGMLAGLDRLTLAPVSAWGKLAHELIARPQFGWGLFCLGLMPIGLAAITGGLSCPLRVLLPLGSLLLLGEPLKSVLGERTGGLTVLVAFGAGWLATSALLLLETGRVSPARDR